MQQLCLSTFNYFSVHTNIMNEFGANVMTDEKIPLVCDILAVYAQVAVYCCPQHSTKNDTLPDDICDKIIISAGHYE